VYPPTRDPRLEASTKAALGGQQALARFGGVDVCLSGDGLVLGS
jgi:hypothetical protein